LNSAAHNSLVFGLFTRFAAYSLLVLTFVATAAAHWPDMVAMWSDLSKGYAITDMGFGNFKLPLLFVVMLLPILFQGPGKISLDFLLARALKADPMPEPVAMLTPGAWPFSRSAFRS
jgi:putative oxidoreductase